MVPKSKLPDGDSEKDSRNFYMMQKIAKLIRVENDKRVEGGRIVLRYRTQQFEIRKCTSNTR